MAASSHRVLYLNDDEEVLSLTEAYLQTVTDRIEVETCTDPAVAPERIQAPDTDFDCLLTDLDMPAMTGLEVLAAIRAHDTTFPVILYR